MIGVRSVIFHGKYDTISVNVDHQRLYHGGVFFRQSVGVQRIFVVGQRSHKGRNKGRGDDVSLGYDSAAFVVGSNAFKGVLGNVNRFRAAVVVSVQVNQIGILIQDIGHRRIRSPADSVGGG